MQVRHQSSLEHILYFNLVSPVPSPREAEEAVLLYWLILGSCESASATLLRSAGRHLLGLAPSPARASRYDASTDELSQGIKLHEFFNSLYVHSPTDIGRTNLVRMILHGLFSSTATTAESRSLKYLLPAARRWTSPAYTVDQRHNVFATLSKVARDLLDGFFLPLKAQGATTAPVSTLLTPPGGPAISGGQGTPYRLQNLRRDVMRRDGNRCVVTGLYDKSYILSERRAGRSPPSTSGIATEAAHIIPHSLNKVQSAGDHLDESRSLVWSILNMFHPGIAHQLAGTAIDNPCNALLLVHDIHQEFGALHCYLEEVPGRPHTYTFQTTRNGTGVLPAFLQPKSATLTFSNNGEDGVPLPSRDLLKLHGALCKMLDMAGAADYVDSLMDEMDEVMCRGTLAGDGTSDFGTVLKMRGLQGYRDCSEEDFKELRMLGVW